MVTKKTGKGWPQGASADRARTNPGYPPHGMDMQVERVAPVSPPFPTTAPAPRRPDGGQPRGKYPLRKSLAASAILAGAGTAAIGAIGIATQGGQEGPGNKAPGSSAEPFPDLIGSISGGELLRMTPQQRCDVLTGNEAVMEAAKRATGFSDISCIAEGGVTLTERGKDYEDRALIIGFNPAGTFQRGIEVGYYDQSRMQDVDTNGTPLPGGMRFAQGQNQLLLEGTGAEKLDISVRYAAQTLGTDGPTPELAAFGATLQAVLR